MIEQPLSIRSIICGGNISLGMAIVMLTAWVPQFHPSPCSLQQQQLGSCNGPTNFQLGILFFGFFGLAIGTGGISSCSIPFAIDQFDLTTIEGRQGTRSFYNMYYVIQTVLLLINVTLVVKIQDSFSWALGFALPTFFMFVAIVFYFAGTKVYAYVEPEGSILSRITQVFVAARRKRHLRLPATGETGRVFYDPPLEKMEPKLPLTKEFRCLNKAALMVENELNDDESNNDPWRLCSIQQIEELKCLLKIMPIWLTGIITYIPTGQLAIFPMSQAMKMDKHLTKNFEIPPGWLIILTMLTIAIIIPIYEKVISPILTKVTKQEGGLTTLQRIGIGHFFAIVTMVIAGFVEHQRRVVSSTSLRESINETKQMSIIWLAPQFIFLGINQAFSIVGQTEFFNKESPDKMRSIGNSLLSLQTSVASNISTFIVNIIHNFSGKQGQPDWLDSDVNKGRLEYFYFIVAGLGLFNFLFFMSCARVYRYKTFVK
uniref:Protein NRT1/ PTR FAMILY 2.13-like isoform X1 n=1 Tax=Cicer arietinum TaxID=3827 RepID=A0A3Q7XLR4_CICAR|nr:protein NRT1/ PTR FAMILY 2.13-like isoform X1 [Cicer arietinum]